MDLKKYITEADLARKWGVHPQRIDTLIRQGRIKGTRIVLGRRLIPKKVKKPADLPPGRKPEK